MLQIASGMYFRPGVSLHETLHRFTFYTNGYRIDGEPIELPIASLRFSTAIASFSPVTVEVLDRLEAERPVASRSCWSPPAARSSSRMSRPCWRPSSTPPGPPITTWCTGLCRMCFLIVHAAGPWSELRRTFDPTVLLTDDTLADAAAFFTRLLAGRRPESSAAGSVSLSQRPAVVNHVRSRPAGLKGVLNVAPQF